MLEEILRTGKTARNMYTSLFIHNKAGTGYAVCANCYDRELDEEERYIDELKK